MGNASSFLTLAFPTFSAREKGKTWAGEGYVHVLARENADTNERGEIWSRGSQTTDKGRLAHCSQTYLSPPPPSLSLPFPTDPEVAAAHVTAT